MSAIQAVPFTKIEINSGFWQQRQLLNRTATITSLTRRFAETGRFDALKCAWREGDPNMPHIFYDSDTAKWIESIAYLLEKGPLPELEAMVEGMIDEIEKHQTEEGYFNSYFLGIAPTQRWKRRNDHELYCAGHLMEAAVAWYHATGRDRFLRIMCRYADYIDQVFRVEDGAAFTTPGHQEIELALVKLYHTTGQEKYLTLSRYFIDMRGANEKDKTEASQPASIYNQSHAPCTEQTEAVGHSVRACYLYAGMADIAREYQDEVLKKACETLFDNIALRRMYITGGIGSTHHGEAFTTDYDLPNQSAYAETCASIALCYFAQRMLLLTCDRKYADVIERVLYNILLCSTSLDGKAFYYTNLQEQNLSRKYGKSWIFDGEWFPEPLRSEVFSCSCCPPNITRFIASIADFMYTEKDDSLYLHQFMGSTAQVGGGVITLKTEYPKDGEIALHLSGLKGKKLHVRIPSWCRQFTLSVPYTMKNGYAVITCDQEDMCAGLSLSMQPELMEANPMVAEDAGKVAVMRGPMVYCMEESDQTVPLFTQYIQKDAQFDAYICPHCGMPILTTQGLYKKSSDTWLYRPYQADFEETTIKLIPYFILANRGAQNLRIWLPVR